MTQQGDTKWGGSKSERSLEQLVAALQKNMNKDVQFYLRKRGILPETAELLRIGYVPGRIGFYVAEEDPILDHFENRVMIPIVNASGELVDLVGRALDHRDPKYKPLYGVEDVFFEEQILKEAEDVILCNGLFDVMTLKQHQLPGICLPNMLLFKEAHVERLKGKRVFICMGNDETGRREAVRIQGMIANSGTEAFIVRMPESIKDINDLFVRAKEPMEAMVGLLNHALEETLYAPLSSDTRNVTVFNEEYMKRHREGGSCLETGIEALDRLTGGGLPRGLTVLAGPPGSGKTTLLKQIADRLSAMSQPVLFVSRDMSPFELWAVSIARIMGVSFGSVLRGEHEPEKVQNAGQVYLQAGKMQWTLECGSDTSVKQVETAVERITVLTGKAPVVFLDAAAGLLQDGGDGHTGLNGLSPNQSKEWSREWNAPVIAVVPSDSGAELSLELRYIPDLVLFLSPEGVAADGAKRCLLEAVKNRSGATGGIRLKFFENKAQFTT